MRTPAQMLGQRIGGACGSMAENFAALLEASGISKDRIKIISAITDDDLRQLCPGHAGESRNGLYMGGASGHEFVMLQLNPKDDHSWTLINTTSDPFEGNGPVGQHRKAISQLRALDLANRDYSHIPKNVFPLLEKLDASDLEMTQYKDFPYSPERLVQAMKQGPIQIPERIMGDTPAELPPSNERRPGEPFVHFHQLTVFSVNTLDDFPHHTFEERLNFAASGSVSNRSCRYSASQVEAAQLGVSPEMTADPTRSCSNR